MDIEPNLYKYINICCQRNLINDLMNCFLSDIETQEWITFSSVGVSEGGNSLVVVVGGGADVGDHNGLTVATQRVLQDAGQLWVPGTLAKVTHVFRFLI